MCAGVSQSSFLQRVERFALSSIPAKVPASVFTVAQSDGAATTFSAPMHAGVRIAELHNSGNFDGSLFNYLSGLLLAHDVKWFFGKRNQTKVNPTHSSGSCASEAFITVGRACLACRRRQKLSVKVL
jgi:hypothetical protein